MIWTLLLGLAQARDGTAIGVLGPLPEEPPSVRPSHKRSKGLDMARVAEPKVLIPVGYNSSRSNGWERYFDESGQVWRHREVEVILSGQPGSSQYIAEAKRKRRVGVTVAIVGGVLFPDTLGCCVSDSAANYAYYESEQSFNSALVSYNLRDQLAVPVAPPVEPIEPQM